MRTLRRRVSHFKNKRPSDDHLSDERTEMTTKYTRRYQPTLLFAYSPTTESLASTRQRRVARAIASSPAKNRFLGQRLRLARYAFKDLAESLY